MEAYGAFVAGRYRHHRNIVWMLGGDMGTFGPRQTAAESGLLAGIESGAGSAAPFQRRVVRRD